MGGPVTSLEISSSLTIAGSTSFFSVQQVLEYCFDMYCHSPALCSDEKTLSYSQLDEASTAFAAFIQTSLDTGKDTVAVTSRPSISSAISLCGALKSGVSVVVVEPDFISQAERCFSDLRVRLVVAEKGDFFNSRYLNRFFMPEQQVMSLNAQGQITKVGSFRGVINSTDPKLWVRSDLAEHKNIQIFQIDSPGYINKTSHNELLDQVESLYRGAQGSNHDEGMSQVADFLKLLAQLLRGQPLAVC